MSPVFIAGRGLSCALGTNLASSLRMLQDGGVAPVPVEVAPGFRWPVYAMAREEGSWLERLGHAVRRVTAETGIQASPDRARLPLFVASSSLDVGYEEQGQGFAGDVQTFADVVAGAIGWTGPVITVSTACTSAINALLAATDLIASGEVPEALVLGIEFSNGFTVAGFGGMQLLSPDRARPFGAERNGLVLGEAVAALHLRAAPSRWRVAGGANVVDGRNPTGAESRAIVAACERALQQSGLRPADIDLLKPQAAGSPGNDAIEAGALKQVFDTVPPMIALKSFIGHTLGAAGAAELVLLTGCLDSGVWPRCAHALDAALGVSLASSAPSRVRHVLFNAIGFGGGHAAMVLEDCGT